MSHTCNGRRGFPLFSNTFCAGHSRCRTGDSVTVFRTTWLCGLCGKGHVKTRAMVLVAAAAPPWVYSPEEV